MSLIFLLAIIQGITEFLPVSSSGHLVLAQFFLGASYLGIQVEAALHLATLFSILVFFHKEIWRLLRRSWEVLGGPASPVNESEVTDRRWPALILMSTFITGAIGYFGYFYFESTFGQPLFVSGALVVMGVILFCAKTHDQPGRPMNYTDAIFFGLAQSLALFPGISRSGITIVCLIVLGLSRRQAFVYSFLAVLPLLLIVSLSEIQKGLFGAYGVPQTLGAMVLAFLVGLAALHVLKRVVMHRHLHWFGYYCILIGAVCFFLIRQT